MTDPTATEVHLFSLEYAFALAFHHREKCWQPTPVELGSVSLVLLAFSILFVGTGLDEGFEALQTLNCDFWYGILWPQKLWVNHCNWKNELPKNTFSWWIYQTTVKVINDVFQKNIQEGWSSKVRGWFLKAISLKFLQEHLALSPARGSKAFAGCPAIVGSNQMFNPMKYKVFVRFQNTVYT